MENHSLFQWALTAIVMVAVAWGGCKYALGDYGKKISHHQDLIEGLRKDMALMAPLATTAKIQDDIRSLVPFGACRDKQNMCRSDNENSNCEILKKIDKMSEAMALQDEKREAGKDKFQAVISEMSRQVADLTATIRERGKAFRKDDSGEHNSWV